VRAQAATDAIDRFDNAAEYTKSVHDRDGRSPPPRDPHLTFLDPVFHHLVSGYIVHGIKRRSSSYNHPRLEHIMEEGASKKPRLFGRSRAPPRPRWSISARARERVRRAGLVDALGAHPRRTTSRAFPRRDRHFDLSPDRVRVP
jgi:hypothetical protein